MAPVPGTRGSCALCGFFGHLTESHVFPKSVGNNIAFRAHGYHSTSTGEASELLPRRFPKGVCFRTLCQGCNSKLGGSEDREITSLFRQASNLLRIKNLILPDQMVLTVRPNRLIRAILAYLVTANDKGMDTKLDEEVREIFDGKISVKDTTFRVYYWPYTGRWLTIIRDLQVLYNFGGDPIWMQVAKFKPLGFAVTDTRELHGLPCINDYACNWDDQERSIPWVRSHQENHQHWPANPGRNGVVLSSADCVSVIAVPTWRT